MSFIKPEFARSEIERAKAHVLSCYPNEGGGVISGGVFYPLANMSAEPSKFIEFDPVSMERFGGVEAVIHSHPNGKAIPSHADMESQISMDCIFGIMACNEIEVYETNWWGDFTLETSLIGRKFVHGIYDCYSLIRAYYWQVKRVKLPDFPRDDEWWLNDKTIYEDNFAKAGFRRVSRSEVQAEDVFLGQIRSPVPNHGGIFLDRGLGVHHLAKSLSAREAILRWEKYMTHFLRYEG